MKTNNILMIVTSAATMGDTGRPTGVWLEEVATPYYAFLDSGAKVTIASIAGGEGPVDPSSVQPAGKNEASVERFFADPIASGALKATVKLADIDVAEFDAIFMPGGHGTMWDLPGNPTLIKALTAAWSADKVIATVCHGAAGLVSAVDASGVPLVKGRRVAGFTDAEERAAGLDKIVPFLVESRIRSLGANFESGENWLPFAVADGRLVTGQNPASSALTAELTLKALATR